MIIGRMASLVASVQFKTRPEGCVAGLGMCVRWRNLVPNPNPFLLAHEKKNRYLQVPEEVFRALQSSEMAQSLIWNQEFLVMVFHEGAAPGFSFCSVSYLAGRFPFTRIVRTWLENPCAVTCMFILPAIRWFIFTFLSWKEKKKLLLAHAS